MSRIDELKKQHPTYALSAIDIYKMMSPNQSNKYVEMLIKLDKSNQRNRSNEYRRELIEHMVTNAGLDYNYLETFDVDTLMFLFNSFSNIMNGGSVRQFTKFASFIERKLIENTDVTTYSSWDEIDQAVALAELKLIDKETAKQIKKVYEDDEWLSLRPLSLEASMKYGANTKWCTTTESGQYYARYSSRGILIYNINKKTGYKVACFKNLDPNFDNEFSWWDVTDKKIEVLDSEAPSAVLEAIRNEIKNTSVANQLLMTKAESDKLELYKEGRTFNSGPDISHGYRSGGIVEHIERNSTTINWNPSTGTNTTLQYNPGTYTTGTTLTTGGISSYATTGNIGMATTTPNTQLSITGDVEINNGDLVFRADGDEIVRYTSSGLIFPERQPEQPTPITGDDRQQIYNELDRYERDEPAEDASWRLEQMMASQMAEANERVAQKHLSLLDDIELGTLSSDIKLKMQMLAGIKTTSQRIQEMDDEIKRLRSEEAQPEVVHLSIWNKIKNTGRKLSRTFTNRSKRQIGDSKIHPSWYVSEEAVKQSQEL